MGKIGFFQDEMDSWSMGRLIAFIASIVGSVIAIAGLIAFFVGLDGSITVLSIGVGLFGSGELFKFGSKFTEKP